MDPLIYVAKSIASHEIESSTGNTSLVETKPKGRSRRARVHLSIPVQDSFEYRRERKCSYMISMRYNACKHKSHILIIILRDSHCM